MLVYMLVRPACLLLIELTSQAGIECVSPARVREGGREMNARARENKKNQQQPAGERENERARTRNPDTVGIQCVRACTSKQVSLSISLCNGCYGGVSKQEN